ncbi:putative peptidoglycan lipid II flippase [Rhodovulum imhoffii]|uniref:Probable lipid II flippase MurJ n=1 Tax=Rhodovulum imhoffii TaxID=365340 RepID=A0A2T5BNX8_9RHOB|nr:murein biosynthesis integral membrane protein MurJ [Rhodovulum imhoffii]MBK5933636.1 murein biosynthesis integral membrane protein MurJ [Rhodovulum imhoffii]PTN00720.1 putative peptidoglycan lipid II flippase [Rhodovulum imhoffii]
MRPIRLVKGFVTVGGWTLASRILGFVRDILIAAWLGTGPAHQAFVVAFSLPNLFRRFFAEGAFNMAFIPMFSKRLESGDDPEGFARDAFSALGGILIVLTLLAMAAMPWMVLAMASGFYGQEQFDLAVLYGRIAFPYILFISLAALLSGVLNAAGRFAAAAAAPVLLNVLFIAAMVGAALTGGDLALALSWTVPVAGIAQLALVWIAARRANFTLVPHLPRLTPDLKRLAIIAAPAALAGGVVQVNLLVGRQVASYFDSAVSWLYNADRLYQLPLGVVAIAIGVVLLPDLSRRLKAGDEAGGRASLNRATEFALALTLPAAAALMVIPGPLVSVLFERGAFGPQDTAQTALAVAVYGAGLPAFVLQKVLQPLFFARADTRRPFYYAVGAMGVNAGLAIGLAPFIGFIAAALATTAAGWAMVGQLWLGSRRMGMAATFDERLIRRAPRIVLASALMGLCLWGGAWGLAPWLKADTLRYGALALLIALGIVSYFGFGHLLGAFHLSDFRNALKRQR